jgi:hypothetical protein
MQFADPRARGAAYLILRHLYDGDIIEWPIPDDHPMRPIFAQLEAEGYVARWDRVWPLHDRYRLTEKGIATIEAVYRPAGAPAFFDDIRRRNLPPVERRNMLLAQRLDPNLWPLLHDPSVHWTTFGTTGARWHQYFWEDQAPPRRRRRQPQMKMGGGGGGVRGGRVHHVVHHVVHHRPPRHHPHVHDLDREADAAAPPIAPAAGDYDVS